MILIADSGSTKCSWALCNEEGNLLSKYRTIGFNPYFINSGSIIKHLEDSELNVCKNKIQKVFFYGAGCSSSEKNLIIENPFKTFFKNAKITIQHDLDALIHQREDARKFILLMNKTKVYVVYWAMA